MEDEEEAEEDEEDIEKSESQRPSTSYTSPTPRMSVRQQPTKKQKIGDAMLIASESLRSIAAQESPVSSKEEPDDDAALFGKTVTVELRKIKSKRSRHMIKMKVQEMLFEAQEKEEDQELHPRPHQASPLNRQPVSTPQIQPQLNRQPVSTSQVQPTNRPVSSPQVQPHSYPSSSSYQMQNILNMDPWSSYQSQ